MSSTNDAFFFLCGIFDSLQAFFAMPINRICDYFGLYHTVVFLTNVLYNKEKSVGVCYGYKKGYIYVFGKSGYKAQ